MKNIKNKISSFIGGIIFLIIGIILLFYNEGRTAKTETMIKDASKEYTDVSSTKIDSQYEQKLIATTGNIYTNGEKVTDPIFEITVETPKLKRVVEMYQWQEECDTNDEGGRTCHYDKVWSEDLIDSSFFEQEVFRNPTEMKYKSETFYNRQTKLGEFKLNDELLAKLSTNANITELNSDIATKLDLVIDGKYYTDRKIDTGAIHEIGDIRISFYYNDAKEASVMAIQSGETFKPYTSKTGYEIEYISEKKLTGAEILTNLTTENNSLKWILRFVGIVLVCVGFMALSSPIQALANIIPLLGGYLSWAIGWVSSLLGLAVSFIVIAIAWLRYRPLISIILIVGAIGIVIVCKKLFTKKEEKITSAEQLTKIIPEDSELVTNDTENTNTEEKVEENIEAKANDNSLPPTSNQATQQSNLNLREFYHPEIHNNNENNNQ